MAQLGCAKGFLCVRLPRRGIYIVRKTRIEVIEDDHRLGPRWKAWRARLITEHASDAEIVEIVSLRQMFATFEDGALRAHLDEYSEAQHRVPPGHHPA